MNNIWLLVIILLISVIVKNNLLAAAAAVVIIMELLHLGQLFSLIDRRGIEIGLMFLTVAALVPFANGKISIDQVFSTFTSTTGIFAIIGGILGAYLNAQGISLIQLKPDVVPGIIIGMIISVTFFGGVPVGPVMAAGFTALLLALFGQ